MYVLFAFVVCYYDRDATMLIKFKVHKSVVLTTIFSPLPSYQTLKHLVPFKNKANTQITTVSQYRHKLVPLLTAKQEHTFNGTFLAS